MSMPTAVVRVKRTDRRTVDSFVLMLKVKFIKFS